MEGILLAIEIVVSLIVSVWIYLWFSKRVIAKYSSNPGGRVPDVYFLLKRWWAEWCIISKRKADKLNTINYEPKCEDNLPIIKDEDSCNSVLYYAADQKGNSIFLKFSRRRRREEVSLQFTTSNGQIYVLPDYPNTIVETSLNHQEWSAVGLKIQLLEAQKRWRITYNGLLRNLSQGAELNDENIKHVRLNLIFIANNPSMDWPGDWSSKLHADALAGEPWKSPKWMNKINLMDYTGYDQWGSIIGQVTFQDSSVLKLYLRGLSQRRWGKHESCIFKETVTIFGTMSNGALYYLGASSTKYSFPRIRFGHFKDVNDKMYQIDWLDLELSDFFKENQTLNFEEKRKIVFKAGKERTVIIEPGDETSFHCGRPWNWTNKIINIKSILNGSTGIGVMELSCPNNDPSPVERAPKLRYAKPANAPISVHDYILFFHDGKCQNENIVGGKGFSLAALTCFENTDFIIPAGFCVTIFALELQLQTHPELQQAIDEIESTATGRKKGDLQKTCEEAEKIIATTPMVEPVREAISKAIEQLESSFESTKNSNEAQRYAIRSSAIGEDSEETSAAGQNSTYLAVRGFDDVIKSVAKCWASLFSYRSVEYRKQHGLPTKVSMGVCIQRMVNAEAAGVMFTRHPSTGDPSNITITANYGLGETVVSAMIEPDTITVHKSWNDQLTIKSSIAGRKSEKMLMSDDGVSTIALNEKEIQRVSILDKIVLRLAAIGLHVETLFGSGRDIEWAVVGEEIFLLQARPITALNAWTDFELMHELDSGVPGDSDIMTFANVGEVFPYPVSPLTISTIIKYLNKLTAEKQRRTDDNYIYITDMRCLMDYYKTFHVNVEKEISLVLQAMEIIICGKIVVNPEIHRIARERYGLTSWTRRLYFSFDSFYEMWRNSIVAKETKRLDDNLILNLDDFKTAYSLYNEISRRLDDIEGIIYGHMFSSRVNVIYQLMAFSFLTQGYKELGPDHFTDIAILLSSCSNVVSAEVPTLLKNIALTIAKNSKVEEFRNTDPVDGIHWLKLNCPIAAEQLESFFVEHGHRCIQELDFLSEPWSLNPEKLVATIQALTISSDENKSRKTLSLEETVASLKTPKKSSSKWFLKKIMPFFRESVKTREFTKGKLVNTLHKFKLAYKQLGVLMVSEGYLPSESLVFFLTHPEIGQVLKNRNSLVQKAHRRKRIYAQLREFKYPELNTGMVLPIKTNLEKAMRDDCTKIQGTSVQAGYVLGRACVINDYSEVNTIQQGDILITHCTDIAWSPYFPLLSGIVTELGGIISHGAVVAREYGLPCIIGVNGATHIFRTGDTVLLAADIGVLQMIKQKE